MGQVDVVVSPWVKRFRGLTWVIGRKTGSGGKRNGKLSAARNIGFFARPHQHEVER